MTDKRKALEPILEKVGKLFAMLGSDNREEVATTVGRMNELLRKNNLDWHDLWTLGWAEKQEDLASILSQLFAKDVDVLLKIAEERAKYFCNDAVFADVIVRGHRQTFPVESKTFEKWLLHEFFIENS